MTNFFVGLINIYQKILSPDHSFWAKQKYPYGYCRFYPSCSEYVKLSILRHGVTAGLLRGIWRVMRCNPFSRGGIDV